MASKTNAHRHSIIRRSAFRAISTSNLAITRSISSAPSPFLARKSAQISALQISKRWNSDLNNGEESKQDAADQNEQNTVTSAIKSAAESVSENAQAAKEYVGSAASGAAAAAGIAAESTPSGGEEKRDRLALEPTNSIYIGNLLFEITQEDLRREFDSFGEIKKCTIATDVRGLSKGYVAATYFSSFFSVPRGPQSKEHTANVLSPRSTDSPTSSSTPSKPPRPPCPPGT